MLRQPLQLQKFYSTDPFPIFSIISLLLLQSPKHLSPPFSPVASGIWIRTLDHGISGRVLYHYTTTAGRATTWSIFLCVLFHLKQTTRQPLQLQKFYSTDPFPIVSIKNLLLLHNSKCFSPPIFSHRKQDQDSNPQPRDQWSSAFPLRYPRWQSNNMINLSLCFVSSQTNITSTITAAKVL
jgi:hypothetical protein